MIYRLVLFAIAISSVAHAAETVADSIPEKVVLSKQVQITSTRKPIGYSSEARVVRVLGRKQLEAIPASSVADLLSTVNGVDVRSRGTSGAQSDISIRGGSFDQVLVLLNGIPMNDPQTGHFSMNLPIDVHDIESIEILEGPGARSLGSNAFSGAVNIRTVNSGTSKAKISIGAAENNAFNGFASAFKNTSDATLYASASHRKDDGFTSNTNLDWYNFFANASASNDLGVVSAMAGHNSKEYGARNFYTYKFPEQYEKTQTTFAALKFMTNGDVPVSGSAYWRRNRDRFQLFRNDQKKNVNYHQTDAFGVDLGTMLTSAIGTTSFGVGARLEKIMSNVLGTAMSSPIPVPGEDAFYTKSDSRTVANLFAEHTFSIGNLTATLGAMGLHNSVYGWKAYSGADFSFKLNDGLTAFASLNQSNRLPSFTDIYYSDRATKGNPDLVPEQSISAEIGAKMATDVVNCSISGFARSIDNMIDYVYNTADSLFHAANLAAMRVFGAEASMSFMPKQLWGERFPVSSVSVGYSYNFAEKAGENLTTRYSMDFLKHKTTLSIAHELAWGVAAAWNFSLQKRNGAFDEAVEKVLTGQKKNFDTILLTNLQLMYRFGNYEVNCSAQNLFDVRYYDYGNVELPGRVLKIEFSAGFGI